MNKPLPTILLFSKSERTLFPRKTPFDIRLRKSVLSYYESFMYNLPCNTILLILIVETPCFYQYLFHFYIFTIILYR